MRRFLKSFGIGVLSLAIITAIIYLLILFVVPNVVDLNKYKDQISSQIEKNTGFKFSAEDMDLKFSYSPFLNLYAHHVKLLYPNGEQFLKITDADIKIRVLPIILKKIEINDVVLTRPIINLTLYGDCSTSLEKYLKSIKPISSSLSGFELVNKIPDIKLNRYKLKIRDVNLYSPFVFEGDKLLLSDFEFDKSIHIKTKGVLSSNKIDYINYDIDIESFLTGLKDKKFFKVSPFMTLKKYNVNSNIYAHLKIKNKDNNPEILGNANLDNLGLKINSKSLNNNSVKLAFDGQDVEITAKVFTSVKDKAIVSGKVSYGTKRYLDLKVKALNADISNLEELATAVLDSLNIKNQFKDYEASGIANLDFQIKSNFKKIKSQGVAQITNASLVSKLNPLEISNINANISFLNNQIKIMNAKALVNSTPLSISGNISDDAEADIMISGDRLPLAHLSKLVANKNSEKYIVENGVLSFKTFIKGKLSKLNIKMDAKIANLTAKDKQSKLVLKTPLTTIDLKSEKNGYSGVINISNVDIASKELKGSITSKNIGFNFTPKDLVLNKAILSFDGSPLIFEGNVNNYIEKPDFNIDFNGKLSANRLYKCISHRTTAKAVTKGNLPVRGKINGNLKNSNIDIQIAPNSSNYVSFLVVKELLNKPSLLNISIALKDNSAAISDLSLYKLKSNIILSDDFNSNLAKSVKITSVTGKISDLNNIKFENLNISVPDSVTFSMAGLNNSEISVKTDVLINGKFTSPQIKGNLVVNHLAVPDYNLKSDNINLVFDNSNIYLKAPDLNVKNCKFAVVANILPKLTLPILVKDMRLTTSNFDLSSVASSFAGLSNSQISQGFSVPVKIVDGTANVANFKAASLHAANAVSKFSLDNNILKVYKMTADAYNGKVWGNITYNFLYATTGINVFGRSLDASPSVIALTGRNDSISGKLDFDSNVTMLGYSRAQQVKSLKGKMKFTIHNGQVGTLGKFEHFLYAQNLISQTIMRSTINLITQAVASKNTGRFKSLNADITFNDGYANISRLVATGPNMSMLVTGRLSLLTAWADLDILGKVSQEVANVLGPFGELSLSNIASHIPRLNNVSLPNLFFNNFNLVVTPDVIARIPSLTPKTDLKTKNFNVKIFGDVDSVKSVKSFKWLVLRSDAPQVQNSYSSQSAEIPATVTQPVNRPVVPIRRQQAELPDFLNNLPDTIK